MNRHGYNNHQSCAIAADRLFAASVAADCFGTGTVMTLDRGGARL
jgi:hypothetical protein